MTIESRPFSTVQRHVLDGNAVYEKHHKPSGWRESMDLVRMQLTAEVELVRKLQRAEGLGRRLGILEIVDYDLETAKIVTRDVPGDQLSTVFRHDLSALAPFLTGRWLRIFQAIAIDSIPFVSVPSRPDDLAAYCDIRIRRIKNSGYAWPDKRTHSVLLKWLDESARRSNCGGSRVVCHGDYGPGNIIWDGHTLTPIDFASCGIDHPLVDLTYFVHHLEMMKVFFPWRPWPIRRWTEAILRGYEMPDAESRPIFKALKVRHMLGRLRKSVANSSRSGLRGLHDVWIRRRLQAEIEKLIRAE